MRQYRTCSMVRFLDPLDSGAEDGPSPIAESSGQWGGLEGSPVEEVPGPRRVGIAPPAPPGLAASASPWEEAAAPVGSADLVSFTSIFFNKYEDYYFRFLMPQD
jgi:hypothetical protein